MISARVLLRHLHGRRFILDVATVALAGALALTVLLLASITFANAIIFEGGLHYDRRVVGAGASSSDFGVRVSSGIDVARFQVPGSGGARKGDLERSAQPQVWDANASDAGHLLGSDLTEGRASSSGVVIDETVAARLGVGVGDEVDLIATQPTPIAECVARVSGVVRPYQQVTPLVVAGLVIVPTGTCGSVIEAGSDKTAVSVRYSDEPSAAGLSHAQELTETALQAAGPQISGLIIPVLLIGLLFWLLSVARMAARLRDDLAVPAEVLTDLGCRPSRVRAVFIGILLAGAGLGVAVSAGVGHVVLLAVAHFYTQPLHVGALALVFFFLAALLILRAARALARPGRANESEMVSSRGRA